LRQTIRKRLNQSSSSSMTSWSRQEIHTVIYNFVKSDDKYSNEFKIVLNNDHLYQTTIFTGTEFQCENFSTDGMQCSGQLLT